MGDATEYYSKQQPASPARTRTPTPPQSHERAITARKNGLFDDEIVP